MTRLQRNDLRILADHVPGTPLSCGTQVYVRAQDIEVHEKGESDRRPSDGCWLVSGRVVDVLYGGVRSQVVVTFGGLDVVARVPSSDLPEVGAEVDCRFAPTAAFVYAAD